ncbi:MAG TPA: hypothetical protein VNA25_30800 [Phycisphaerae bacterium]|nr:hypothetical protein [Phycisphaerae bacterium]
MRNAGVLATAGLVVVIQAVMLSCADLAEGADDEHGRYLRAVRTFADNVLRYGRDVYGPEHAPLFVDGINIDTHEPVVWRISKGHVETWRMPSSWVLSNLASQQHFFKVLVALSDLTGDLKYKQAAVEATRYAFDHLRHESGLLFWGGHAAWDLATEQPVGEGRSGSVAGKHELKCNLPFYELMWEVDSETTKRFIEAFWSNHILRWDILDMNRHGYYQPILTGEVYRAELRASGSWNPCLMRCNACATTKDSSSCGSNGQKRHLKSRQESPSNTAGCQAGIVT